MQKHVTEKDENKKNSKKTKYKIFIQILETLGSSSWISSAALKISSISLLFDNEDGTFPAIPV